ncbi:hypothetical protein C8R43DRAFT_982000 [Mycena crocata]|nr:hypothetical protein C8R43DRAFT_982000 [Mycena crocata]
MSQKSHGYSNKHALPDNPAFIDFTRSDGDSTLWPQNTTRVIDEEGCVNFMQPLGLDEPLSVKWRVGVGDAISVALKLPPGQPHVLRGFPSGYRMFDHHKGKSETPRHDVYLFGSETKARFRSVPEFIPHALWLMGDGSDPCKCKYCTKKPQREITSSMGNLLRSSSQSPSPSRPYRPKPERIDRKKDIMTKPRLADRLQSSKTYAAVQKTNLSPHIQAKNTMLVERNNNLREASRPSSQGSLPRWFRTGELVWCALEPAIMGPGDEAIKFWPAIIDEVKLGIDPTPLAANLTAEQSSAPWATRQFTKYQVQFLAISKSYLLPDHMVIPYQSHIVPHSILKEMSERPIKDWDFDAAKLASFDPCPSRPASPPTFISSLTPFALALQIASMFSQFWCLTDEWEAKLTLPSATPRPPPPPSSLQSAIEFAGSNNAYVGSISSGPRGTLPPIRPVNQTRFQGMWWGGERIWADELVRLKVPRSCLAPAGAQHIFAPSAPGNKAKSLIDSQGHDRDPAAYGALSRGVFMKIDTICIAEGTGSRECRVCGMLYELADADWEDPNLPRNVESISTGIPSTTIASAGQSPGPRESHFFALPPPPAGYKFRPILAPGYEAALSLSIISGRYYPGLLQHPLMTPYLNDVMPLSPETMMSVSHLWALEGLFGGYKNSVDPTKYKPHREKMISDATKGAMDALVEHVQEREARAQAQKEADARNVAEEAQKTAEEAQKTAEEAKKAAEMETDQQTTTQNAVQEDTPMDLD